MIDALLSLLKASAELALDNADDERASVAFTEMIKLYKGDTYMSWQSLNDILGKALFDQHFANILLADPLQAVQEGCFDLTAEELDVLAKVKAENIIDLSTILLMQLKNNRQ